MKAERDKKVLYPQPPPKKEEPKKAIAKDEKPKERASFSRSYMRVNGKLVPVDTPLNKTAEDAMQSELKKQADKKKPKP